MTRRCLDLFCGAAGGWSTGVHRAGWRTVAACEFDPWRRAVFAARWPGVQMYDDVRTLTADQLRADGVGPIDCIIGSPPCQDASTANARGKGIDGERTGLFWDYVRLVREVRPAWICAENVPGLRARGYDRVHDALEAAGYTVWPLVVGAWHAGAPHRRNRVWIIGRRVADAHGGQQPQKPQGHDGEHEQRSPQRRGQFVAAGSGAGAGVGSGPVAEGDAGAGLAAARDEALGGRALPVAHGQGQHGEPEHGEVGGPLGRASADANQAAGGHDAPRLRADGDERPAGARPGGDGAPAHPGGDGVRQQQGRRGGPDGPGAAEPGGTARDADHPRLAQREGERGDARAEQQTAIGASLRAWDHWNGGAPDLGRVDDGLSAALAARRGLGRACLAAYGDSVVPALTEQIARAIDAVDLADMLA